MVVISTAITVSVVGITAATPNTMRNAVTGIVNSNARRAPHTLCVTHSSYGIEVDHVSLLLIIVVLLLLFGGGGGYYGYSRYGGRGAGGIVGTVFIVLLVIWLLGGIQFYQS